MSRRPETISSMAERAPTLMAALAAAQEITGSVCTTEEYDQAAQAFSRWLARSAMKGALARVVADGKIRFEVQVITPRGTLRQLVADPREWHDALVLLGLE